ncbi:pantetheine-phosphate adenylyltransferase, partial [Tremellales sp. Uapishka_1]
MRTPLTGPPNVFLVLPFTTATYTDPTLLLPIIYRALLATSPSTSTFTVLLSSPSSPQLFSELRTSPVAHWRSFQTFLAKIYATLAAAQWKSGKVMMDVEVHFDGEGGRWDDRLQGETIKLQGYDHLPYSSIALPTSTSILATSLPAAPSLPPSLPSLTPGFPVVALGGTFDHLHAAHKLLLQLSLFLTTRVLIVGLMSDSLLASKSNAALVEPITYRIAQVTAFLRRCGASDAQLDIQEIHDAFGPTAYEPDIQALVVSRETRQGGEMVNRLRGEKQLPALELFVIDVISSNLVSETEAETVDLTEEEDERLKELKMGSTAIRQWIREHE